MSQKGKLRKVAVGPDYKSAMKYIVGREYDGGRIEYILIEDGWLNVYLYSFKEKAISLWKYWNIATTPIHFENDLDF